MLTAIDGQVNGGGGVDRLRMKIWDKDAEDAIVYDNGFGGSDDHAPASELGGGKVMIHSKGLPLRAAASVGTDGESLQSLTYATLQGVVDQAYRYWATAGADSAQLNLLAQLDVRIADLSGDVLGEASESTNLVWIDRDAAGVGWSMDANRGHDLLSTVTHEFGHMVGLGHDDMSASLEVAQRQLPRLVADSAQVRAADDLFGGRLERHAGSLRGSLGQSISRRSERRDALAEQSRAFPGVARNAIDQILFGAEEPWSVDEYFDSEEGADESNENWLEDLVVQL
jgi:hypothetical protein